MKLSKIIFFIIVFASCLTGEEAKINSKQLNHDTDYVNGHNSSLELELNLEQYFNIGNRYYQNQEYLSALKIYQKIIDSKESKNSLILATIYYNLGNTLYKLYESEPQTLVSTSSFSSSPVTTSTNHYLSRAIFSYRKSLILNSNLTSALVNLITIKQKIGEQYNPSLLEQIYFFYNTNNFIIKNFLGSVFLILILCFLIKKYSKISKTLRHVINITTTGFLLLYLLLLAFISINGIIPSLLNNQKSAIVVLNSKAKAEPNNQSKTVLALREGFEVVANRVNQNREWVEVEVNNQRGWVEKEKLLFLNQ